MGHQPLQRHVTAASVADEHACETAEPQIHAQRVATWSAERRLAPSNPLKTQLDGWGGRHWLGRRNGSGQHRGAPATPKARHSRQRRRWARMRNSRTPAGFMPNGFPLGRQSRCRLAPSNPLKTKLDGWGGRHWLGWRNGSGQHRGPPATPKARHSRQRRRWARMRNGRTPAGFRPNGLPLGRQSAVWHLRTR